MKRILLFLLAALLLLLPAGILVSRDLPGGPVYDETYYGQLSPMVRKAAETEGKKLLVLGSSSVAFGLDSALLEEGLRKEGLDITVCSFGLYGAIGTRTMMELSRDLLKEGDVLVFAPEPFGQSLSDYFSAEHLWYAMDGDRSLFWRMEPESQGSLVGNYVSFVHRKSAYVSAGTKAKPSGVYARASFDENGDMTKADRPGNVMPMGYDANNRIRLVPELYGEDFLVYINDYFDELTRKGVEVVFAYAPMNEAGMEPYTEDSLKVYDYFLRKNLRCPVLGDPREMILPAEWFYDSNYHLNESGMELRTIRLLNDLKTHWGITTKTELPLPEMPALLSPEDAAGKEEKETRGNGAAGGEEEAGNGAAENGTPEGGEKRDWNADAHLGEALPPEETDPEAFADEALFLYEEGETSVTIVGVREAAKAKTLLCLPPERNGKPVTEFTETALRNLSALEEVVLPESLRLLHDGCFSGCSSLRRVTLRQRNPALLQVGYELLAGTESCKVIVADQEALSEYVNNYFWGFYADSLEAEN